jgi:hypothetical protein
MTLKRLALMAILTYGLLALWAWTGSTSNTETLYAPSVPATVTLGMLTAQQLEDRAEELTATTTTTSTTVAPVVVPSDTPCAEWLPLAVQVGWPNDTDILQTLGRIMWRESRCQPDACSKSDSDRPCRDYGLTQGNWTAHHEWWADLGITPDEMFDPATNLRFAYLLYSELEAKGRCGWQPWKLC